VYRSSEKHLWSHPIIAIPTLTSANTMIMTLTPPPFINQLRSMELSGPPQVSLNTSKNLENCILLPSPLKYLSGDKQSLH
jgi:hypothetical protein